MPVVTTIPRQSVDYYPLLDLGMQTAMTSQPMAQTQQPTYATGGPVRHPTSMMSHSRQYHTPLPSRPSSGAWTPAEDQTLMAARASGLNWGPIQQAYFPNKTPNACRKRHERLMERRNADDWDGVKLEQLAKEYMEMRREIWQPLAERTGEKWSVIEAKCMSSGLKNLQSAARSHARRERLENASVHKQHLGHSHTHSNGSNGFDRTNMYCRTFTDDSGLVLEDHETEYIADASSYSPEDRTGSPGRNSRLSGGSSSGMSIAYGERQRPIYGQRLPSLDMGIGSIINRTSGV